MSTEIQRFFDVTRTRLVAATPIARPIGLILVVLGVFAGALYNLRGLPLFGRPFGDYYRIDLDVYRLGGSAFAQGTGIYGQLPLTQLGNPLPFTYPPLAAISFAPMSWMSLASASEVMTIISIGALLASILLTLRSFTTSTLTTSLWSAGAVLAIAFTLEPVFSTFDYGQINMVLMALVIADCLLPKTLWPRGTLIGFVAALKLTPAVFVLFLLLRKDFRAAIVTGVSFAACTAIGFAMAPNDSVRYWTEILVDSNRIGRPAYPGNQSIMGVIARLGWDGLRMPLWVALAAGVLVLTIIAMRRALDGGHIALALGVNAMAGLLVSPVSWSHHWVWAVPLMLTLGVFAYRRRSPVLAAWVLLGAVMFHFAPHWQLAHGRYSGLGWPVIDQLAASSYVWWGLGTLVLVAVTRWTVTDEQPADDAVATAA